MSEKALPKKRGGIPTGAVGLILTIIFSVAIALSSGWLSVVLGGALGLVGLVFSIVGITTRSGRVAGVFGIIVFILGCLMTFSTVLDLTAHAGSVQPQSAHFQLC
jgi:bacteriorhodopsin